MKRKHIPMRIQRDAALLQLGLDPETAELHHNPPLALREIRLAEIAPYYVPDELDPNHLMWMSKEEHKRQTFGSKATTAGSDIHRIAKVKRLTKKEEEFRRRLQAKADGGAPLKSRWPKRKFR